MEYTLKDTIEDRVRTLEKPTDVGLNSLGIDTSRTYHKVMAVALSYSGIPLLSHVDPVQSAGYIVELGCGTGLFTRALYDQLGNPIYAFDYSSGMLEVAKEHNDVEDIHFYLMDFDKDLDRVFDDNSVDCIVSNCALFTSSDKDKLIETCSRKLKQGGELAFSVPPMGASDLFESYLQLLSVRRYKGEPETVSIQEAEDNLEKAKSLTKLVCESFVQPGERYFSRSEHNVEEIKLDEPRLLNYLSALIMRSKNRDLKFRQALARELYDKTIGAGIKPSFIHFHYIFNMKK